MDTIKKQWSKVQSVHVDGLLYVIMGVCTAIETTLGSDAAFKYMNPYFLWWFKLVISALLGGATSLKMYRSTQFADHKRETGNTSQFTNPNPPPQTGP